MYNLSEMSMPPLSKEDIEKAIDAWMEKKFAQFGRWTAGGLLALAFGVLCKWLFVHGMIPG